MPVRSSRSSVLVWPDRRAVDEAVRRWAVEVVGSGVGPRVRIGYVGSYARGDWGVGSDVDLVMIVDRSDEPFERRALAWDATSLPVPADLVVYTAEEWSAMAGEPGFVRSAAADAVWVYP